MRSKLFIAAVIGILAGFTAGFLVANALNRNEIESAKAEASALRNAPPSKPNKQSKMELSKEELQAKIAEADKNADNFRYQKTLGMALYTYAAMKQDSNLLQDVARLLERAHKLNPDDYDVLVSLGNVRFDLGQVKKDEKLNLEARDLYGKALEKNGRDVSVRTDLGLTFLLNTTPQPEKAIKELNAALALDPKNEKALQYITQAYVDAGDRQNARKYLKELKEVDPQNPSVAELEGKVGG